jgi:outer membrane protein assembly factor BamA
MALADSLRGVSGTDRSYQEAVFATRLFQPLHGIGLDGHVFALRGSAGYAQGPGADRFHFDAGGADGQLESVTGLGLFGGGADDFPVRGYALGERSGRFAWSATAEYRFPIVRLNRGLGLVPVHLESIHADFFADAANAWGPDANPERSTLASVGAELSFDLTLLFSADFPLRFGFAAPRTGSPSVYLRLGPSF